MGEEQKSGETSIWRGKKTVSADALARQGGSVPSGKKTRRFLVAVPNAKPQGQQAQPPF